MKALILALTLLFFSINAKAKFTAITTKKKQINTVKAINITKNLFITLGVKLPLAPVVMGQDFTADVLIYNFSIGWRF